METSNQYIYKRDLVLSGLGIVGIGIFIFSTNPSTLPAVLLLLLPIIIASTSFVASKLVLEVFTNYTQKSIKLLSGIIAAGPTLIVVLGSLGQLGIQDIILAIVLLTGVSWYMRRQRLFA